MHHDAVALNVFSPSNSYSNSVCVQPSFPNIVMEQLPEQVKAILQGNLTSYRPCCSSCGRHESKSDPSRLSAPEHNRLVPCSGCQTAHYCSTKCQEDHAQSHKELCEHITRMHNFIRHYERFPSPLWQASGKVGLGDKLVERGYLETGSSIEKGSHYYRKALSLYLECIAVEPLRQQSQLEKLSDKAMVLLIVLGGDAQVLLEFFNFMASVDPPTTNSSDSDPDRPPPPSLASPESKEQRHHPLLALHGFFEADTTPNDCTVSALYLLAIFRSLVQHQQTKTAFQTYKDTIKSSLSLPQKVEALDGTIASFLWGDHGYAYGEALPAEVRRIVRHIQGNKSDGLSFLQRLADPSVRFSSWSAPQFMSRSSSNLDRIPELWRLLQDCFLSSTFGSTLSLSNFLPASDWDTAKDKKAKLD